MKILIAYDGSECGIAALKDLDRAGLPADIEALVLTAADVWLPEGAYEEALAVPWQIRERTERMREHALGECAVAQDMANAGAGWLRERHPTWRVDTKAVANSPVWAVLEQADAFGAHLVVVGSHGKGVLDRIMLGSVSQTVVTHARCSVRVARCRAGDMPTRPVRLVLGYDGSAPSQVMLHQVSGRAWPAGTEARVVIALDSRMLTTTYFDKQLAVDATTEAHMRDLARKAVEQLQASGLKTDFVIRREEPKRALMDEAEAWEADCIHVGARGIGGLERILLGSVSTAVSARARCSVEIAR